MKNKIKGIVIVMVTFVVMLVIVFKPYKKEVVNLDKFTEYYSEETSVEDGGGLELVDENYYVFEREYIIEGVSLEKNEYLETYEIPKLEIYEVQKGETLAQIADKNGISLEILKANNPGISNTLKIGEKIKILKTNGVFYKVKKGDSLFKISLNYKVSLEDLKKYNNLKTDNIQLGQELFILNPNEEILKRMNRNRSSVAVNEKQFRMPVKYSGITSPFGKRFHPVLKRYIQHEGVDFKAAYVPLKASKDGVVTYVGYMSGYGKIIKINHGNGFETRSAHLDKIYVKEGEKVKVGQIIGKTGMSGRVTGPHLHFEIRKNGKANNPLNYIIR